MNADRYMLMSILHPCCFLRRITRLDVGQILTASSENPNRIGIAQIHATILAIIIAVGTAYFSYLSAAIQGLETEANRQAERINDIRFAKTIYFPKEPQFVLPETARDSCKLARDAIDLLSASSIPGSPYAVGQTIPHDPRERAERALGLLNVIVHSKPFMSTIGSPPHYIQNPEPKTMANVEKTRQWLQDLEAILACLNVLYAFGPQALPFREFMDALAKKYPASDVVFIINPWRVFEDYVANLREAEKIKSNTALCLSRLESFKKGYPPMWVLLLALAFGIVAFFSGVILPLLNHKTRALFLICIPVIYYGAFLIFLLLWLSLS